MKSDRRARNERLKAIFLLGTLKRKRSGSDFSHTETLCELVISDLRQYDVQCEGDYSRATKASLRKRLRKDKQTSSASKTMARNLAFFARLLRENKIPSGQIR